MKVKMAIMECVLPEKPKSQRAMTDGPPPG